MIKRKQSIVATLFINIAVVVFLTAVILLAMWIFQNTTKSNFMDYLFAMRKVELFFVLLFSLFTAIVVTQIMARNLRQQFSLFDTYFKEASTQLKKIDADKLHFYEFETLASSLNNMVDDLASSQAEILFQKAYLQAVLESQENIIFVVYDGTIQSVNRSFLTFFGVKNIKEFYNKTEKFCDLFIEDDGYMHCFNQEVIWKDFITSHPDKVHKVKFLKNQKEHIFIITAAKIDESEKLVISLSDITEVEKERQLFKKAASTDTLTGIANRLKFNTILEQQIAEAKRYKVVFSLIFLDIDNFKNINDTYGHKVGDDVLVKIAGLVTKSIRDSDTFSRWGGEEFALILPRTNAKEAREVAEHIRKKIEATSFGEGFYLTCSFGVKAYQGKESSDAFIQNVDTLLYEAKKAGKNRVCVA